MRHYAGKASETQFADNTNVGTPSRVTYTYSGPAGSGVDFAPGFDLANYAITGGSFPVANIFLDDEPQHADHQGMDAAGGHAAGPNGARSRSSTPTANDQQLPRGLHHDRPRARPR